LSGSPLSLTQPRTTAPVRSAARVSAAKESGGAVVFSCSLLHAVSRVTRGRRYAFLPFLYDDAAAAMREANNRFLGEGVGSYRSAEAAERPTTAEAE
jgi:hypothetical protein